MGGLDMSNQTTAKSNKSWVGILLFLSLGVNIFLGGVVWGRGDHGVRADRVEKVVTAMKSFQQLSPETREKAKAQFKEEWPAIQEQAKGIRTKRQEVRKLLEQENYDAEALDKAFADLRDAVNQVQLDGQKLIIQLAADMSPEERVAFVKNMPKPSF
jgi:uncharacterized membrane protein